MKTEADIGAEMGKMNGLLIGAFDQAMKQHLSKGVVCEATAKAFAMVATMAGLDLKTAVELLTHYWAEQAKWEVQARAEAEARAASH